MRKIVRYLNINRQPVLHSPPPFFNPFYTLHFRENKETRTWKVILHTENIRKTRPSPIVFGNCDATVNFCPKVVTFARGRWDMSEKSRPSLSRAALNGKENGTFAFYEWNIRISYSYRHRHLRVGKKQMPSFLAINSYLLLFLRNSEKSFRSRTSL